MSTLTHYRSEEWPSQDSTLIGLVDTMQVRILFGGYFPLYTLLQVKHQPVEQAWSLKLLPNMAKPALLKSRRPLLSIY